MQARAHTSPHHMCRRALIHLLIRQGAGMRSSQAFQPFLSATSRCINQGYRDSQDDGTVTTRRGAAGPVGVKGTARRIPARCRGSLGRRSASGSLSAARGVGRRSAASSRSTVGGEWLGVEWQRCEWSTSAAAAAAAAAVQAGLRSLRPWLQLACRWWRLPSLSALTTTPAASAPSIPLAAPSHPARRIGRGAKP
eukprot:SAG31_NODE_133_length_23315_cov_4.858847_16_plen_195_part_00